MGDYAAAPDWLAPSLWTETPDVIDMLDIPTVDIINACIDAFAAGDGTYRPTETSAFGGMIALSVYQRRKLVRWMQQQQEAYIAELETAVVPLRLLRETRGETPLWVAETRRGVRVWVRGT